MNFFERQRKRLNLSQSELANILNVSQANISQWENGISLPRTNRLHDIAKALHCNIDELLAEVKEAEIEHCAERR